LARNLDVCTHVDGFKGDASSERFYNEAALVSC